MLDNVEKIGPFVKRANLLLEGEAKTLAKTKTDDEACKNGLQKEKSLLWGPTVVLYQADDVVHIGSFKVDELTRLAVVILLCRFYRVNRRAAIIRSQYTCQCLWSTSGY